MEAHSASVVKVGVVSSPRLKGLKQARPFLNVLMVAPVPLNDLSRRVFTCNHSMYDSLWRVSP